MIMYLLGGLWPGGIERQLTILADSIRKFGIQTFVVSFSGVDEIIGPHIETLNNLEIEYKILPRSRGAIRKLDSLIRLARQLRPEVIHSYEFYLNFAAWAMARSSCAIAIGSIQSTFTREVIEAGPINGRLCYYFPKTLVANNHPAQSAARDTRSIFRSRHVEVVWNGVDIERFAVSNEEKPAPFVQILGMGRFEAFKRWDMAILAMHHLIYNCGLQAELVILGDGIERPKLEKMVIDLGVKDSVFFPGLVMNVEDYLSKAEILVHCSRIEGSPNAVSEGLASGLPVVSTACGEVPWLIQDGETGYVIPIDEQGALNHQLAKLVRDPELRQRMGRHARIWAEKNISVEQFVLKMLKVYTQAGRECGRDILAEISAESNAAP